MGPLQRSTCESVEVIPPWTSFQESDEPIRALSVRQPWAWLIANRWKDIENRTWPTKFRGRFLIHAGQTFDHEGLRWVRAHFPHIPLPSTFDLGGIVGVAKLVDCFAPGSDAARNASGWYMGQYGFVVAEAESLPFHRLKGRLQFFKVKGVA